MGLNYNVILPVDPGFEPGDDVLERIRQEMGEGFELQCHLGYTPDATLARSRDISVTIYTGLHTFFLISSEQAVVSHFGVVIREALRREDDSDSFTTEAPREAIDRLAGIVGTTLRQVDTENLVVLEGDQSDF